METSIPYFDIQFWLVQNIRSIHDIELFITCVGLSMIFVYPADDVREAISRPAELVMSSFHQFVQRALKSFKMERKLIIYLAKKHIKFCAKDFEFFLTLTR